MFRGATGADGAEAATVEPPSFDADATTRRRRPTSRRAGPVGRRRRTRHVGAAVARRVAALPAEGDRRLAGAPPFDQAPGVAVTSTPSCGHGETVGAFVAVGGWGTGPTTALAALVDQPTPGSCTVTTSR